MADMRKQLSYTAAEIDERLGAVPNKVDKVTGKGLSTNDYTDTDKTAVGTIGDKVDKVTGKGLSTNDYTTEEKNKLSGLTQYTDAMALAAVYGTGTEIDTNDDLDDYTTPGVYQCNGANKARSLSNYPGNESFRMEVRKFINSSTIIQEVTTFGGTTYFNPIIYRRVKVSSGWKTWYKFEGTSTVST